MREHGSPATSRVERDAAMRSASLLKDSVGRRQWRRPPRHRERPEGTAEIFKDTSDPCSRAKLSPALAMESVLQVQPSPSPAGAIHKPWQWPHETGSAGRKARPGFLCHPRLCQAMLSEAATLGSYSSTAARGKPHDSGKPQAMLTAKAGLNPASHGPGLLATLGTQSHPLSPSVQEVVPGVTG